MCIDFTAPFTIQSNILRGFCACSQFAPRARLQSRLHSDGGGFSEAKTGNCGAVFVRICRCCRIWVVG